MHTTPCVLAVNAGNTWCKHAQQICTVDAQRTWAPYTCSANLHREYTRVRTHRAFSAHCAVNVHGAVNTHGKQAPLICTWNTHRKCAH
eukprot:2750912-Pyramimonas_sp.AAC.1